MTGEAVAVFNSPIALLHAVTKLLIAVSADFGSVATVTVYGVAVELVTVSLIPGITDEKSLVELKTVTGFPVESK